MNKVYWIESSEGRGYKKLDRDIQVDYLIIGGGVAGITCLYLLVSAGHKAVLIDADRIGYGCSGRNTGKITAQHALVYNSIEKQFDLERARQYYEVNDKALELIETLIARYNIQCDLGFRHVSSPRMRIMPKKTGRNMKPIRRLDWTADWKKRFPYLLRLRTPSY